MCRYSDTHYRSVLICLSCRIGWKGPRGLSVGTKHCGRCGRLGKDMGRDFHVPRQTNTNQWKKIEVMVREGRYFGGCGCDGPGPAPRTYSEAKNWASLHKPWYLETYPGNRRKPASAIPQFRSGRMDRIMAGR